MYQKKRKKQLIPQSACWELQLNAIQRQGINSGTRDETFS